MLALVAGILLAIAAIWSATQASAHTGDVSGTAVCQDNSTYKVTWHLSTSSVPAGKVLRVKANSWSGGTLAPYDTGTHIIADGVAPNAGVDFTQSGIPGNASGAIVSLHLHWTKAGDPAGTFDADTSGSVSLAGNCGNPGSFESWTCDGYFTGGYNYVDGEWVKGDLVKQRNLTAEEAIKACPAPPAQEKWTCDGYFTGGWDWNVDTGKWVKGDLVKQRDLTPEERVKLECDVVTTPPPSTTPPASTPPATTPATTPVSHKKVAPAVKVAVTETPAPSVSPAAKTKALASTGSNVGWLILVGALAIGVGTLAIRLAPKRH